MVPTYTPVESALVLHRAEKLLVGTATATATLSGPRMDAVTDLVALVSGAVYTDVLPETVPVRGVLVREGEPPGGSETGPERDVTGYHEAFWLDVLAFCEASEPSPARTLELILKHAFRALQGQSLGWPDLVEPAHPLYWKRQMKRPKPLGNDRHVFRTATYLCTLYSTEEAFA